MCCSCTYMQYSAHVCNSFPHISQPSNFLQPAAAFAFLPSPFESAILLQPAAVRKSTDNVTIFSRIKSNLRQMPAAAI